MQSIGDGPNQAVDQPTRAWVLARPDSFDEPSCLDPIGFENFATIDVPEGAEIRASQLSVAVS